MLTRKRIEVTPEAAKVHLKKQGWAYRAAAVRLGRTATHLCLVLNRKRISRKLLSEILAMPPKEAA